MGDITRDYSFGGWIREWRIESRFTLREAAHLLEMDFGNLSKMERSELDPPMDPSKIFRICEVYGKKDSFEFIKSIAFSFHVGKLKERFSSPTTATTVTMGEG